LKGKVIHSEVHDSKKQGRFAPGWHFGEAQPANPLRPTGTAFATLHYIEYRPSQNIRTKALFRLEDILARHNVGFPLLEEIVVLPQKAVGYADKQSSVRHEN
jgi:hypothetical protein